MQLLGHLALGFFAALAVRRLTRERINIPLVWVFSILPDVDLLILPWSLHRGPVHSVVLAILVCLPFLLILRRGLPYFAALMTHSLIGDYLNPPVQMLWPLSRTYFEAPIQLFGLSLVVVEFALFSVMVYVMLSRKRTLKLGWRSLLLSY